MNVCIKTFITRIGQGSKYIVCGDLMQSDIRKENGLEDSIRRFTGLRRVGFSQFDLDNSGALDTEEVTHAIITLWYKDKDNEAKSKFIEELSNQFPAESNAIEQYVDLVKGVIKK